MSKKMSEAEFSSQKNGEQKSEIVNSEHGVFNVRLIDERFNEEDMAPLLMGLAKLRENVFCAVYAYVMVPGEVHLLIREREQAVAGCVEYLHENCYGDTEFSFSCEPVESAEKFVEVFARIAQLPVERGLCDNPGEYGYGSWVNDYQGLCSVNVCQTKIVLRRFGFDALYEAVNTPMVEV